MFHLNNKHLTAFPNEQEILIQDGVEYEITEMEKISKTITLISGEEVERDVVFIHMKNKVEKYVELTFYEKTMKYLFE